MEPLIAKSERIYLKILNTGLVLDTCCFYKVYILVQKYIRNILDRREDAIRTSSFIHNMLNIFFIIFPGESVKPGSLLYEYE